MEANTEAIVRLAWARVLGLGDGALGHDAMGDDALGHGAVADSAVRLYRVSEHSNLVTFVRLFGLSAFVGPQWAVDRASAYDDDTLAHHRTLLALSADHAGRGLGAGVLAFADEYVTGAALDDAVVSDDPGAASILESKCPPDDVSEVGLSTMQNSYVLLAEDDRIIAGAGYDEWQGILAHLGVLTALDQRRRGLGTVAAGLAMNEALDAGLVPQWRAHVDNRPSRRLAQTLGFTEVGTQTSVLITAN